MKSCVFYALASFSVVHAANIIFSDSDPWNEGSTCRTKYGVKGICRRLHDCPFELHVIRNFPPNSTTKICSFTESQQPIVCCAESCLRPSYLACESRRRYEKLFKEIHPIHGKEAIRGIHPHVVALGYQSKGNKYEWRCGGSLINKFYVLTAGHCVANQARIRPQVIRVGVHNLTSTEGDIVPVESIIVHPLYDLKTLSHDIALLKVDVTLGADVRPLCLATEVDDPRFAAILGWGATDIDGTMPTPVIQIAELERFVRCNDSLTPRTYGSRKIGIDGTQICAEGGDGLANGCTGDSGSPLQTLAFKYRRERGYVLRSVEASIVGITSFGTRHKGHVCNGVTAYTRVASYLDWIESIVWPHGFIKGDGEV